MCKFLNANKAFSKYSHLDLLYIHVSVLTIDWRIFDHVTADMIPALTKEEQVHVRARANSVSSILKYLLNVDFVLIHI